MGKKYPSGHKKVLILHAPLGVGHGAAAKAIAEAFALKYPEIEVKNIDVLDFVFDIFKQSLPWVYSQTTLKIPLVYKWIYNYCQTHYKFLNNISGVILRKSKFAKFIEDYNPNFIISTNPLPMQLVSVTKGKEIINILSANVCTDFGFYSMWHNKDVNYYFVANTGIKNCLAGHGVDSDQVQVTGIPTSLKFSVILDRKKILGKLRFDEAKPILLIVGGRISYENLLAIVNGVKGKTKDCQFIIVSGRDKVLQNKLKNSKIKNYPSVRIFDFVDNLDELMTAADLIITKAGGLTVSECLVKGLPMIINDIIPGQEEDNVNYVARHGAGIKSSSTEETIEIVNKLFLHPEKLAAMKENCRRIARPDAAKDIVDFVVSKIK